jgi:hypothetical protein
MAKRQKYGHGRIRHGEMRCGEWRTECRVWRDRAREREEMGGWGGPWARRGRRLPQLRSQSTRPAHHGRFSSRGGRAGRPHNAHERRCMGAPALSRWRGCVNGAAAWDQWPHLEISGLGFEDWVEITRVLEDQTLVLLARLIGQVIRRCDFPAFVPDIQGTNHDQLSICNK